MAIGFIGHNDQYSSYQVTHIVHSPYYGRAMVYDIQPDQKGAYAPFLVVSDTLIKFDMDYI